VSLPARHAAAAALVFVAVVACRPPIAGAQQLVPPPEIPETVRPGWTLTPSFSVAPLWDSNVALNSEEQGELEDQVLAVGSGLLSEYRGRRGQLALEYRGVYEFYRRYSGFDAPDHRARLELQRTLNRRISVFARDSFALSPTTNVPMSEVGLITLTRRTTSSNDFRGGVDITVARRSVITTAYSSQWVDLAADEEVQPLLRSGYAHRGDLQFRQRVTSRLTLGAQYDFQHAIVSQGEETFDIQHAGALLELAINPALQFLGAAGYAWQLAGQGEQAESAPAVNAELRYQANRTLWTVGYSRTFLASFGFGGTVQNEELRGGVTVPVGRRWDFSAIVSARDNDPLSGQGPGLRAVSAQGTAAFEIASWLRLEAFTISSWQDALRAGGQISRTRAGVRFVTLYPVRVG
jgi:hypothetical protein